MELSSGGTVSTLISDGWPLRISVQLAVGPDGTPVLCLNESNRQLSINNRSTLHVQLKQYGLKTPQCTIQGSLANPGDAVSLKRLLSAWTKRFGSEAEEEQLYHIDVERVLQIEDFKEVSEAKVLWIDWLGFDVRIFSPPSDIFDVHIPFPREFIDEKGAKSSFNCMSQLAWEKNFHVPDFKKAEQFKQVA